MLTITLAARTNVTLRLCSLRGDVEEKKVEKRVEVKDEVLSMMYLCTDAEFETWRKYSIRRRSFNYLARMRL